MTARNWKALHQRRTSHIRGTERAKHHDPIMAPIFRALPREKRAPTPRKAEMRAEAEALVAAYYAAKPGKH